MEPPKIAPAEQAQPAASDEDKARAEAAAAAAVESHPNKGQFVLYTGPRNAAANADELQKRAPKLGEGTTAEISIAQWAQAGVTSTRSHRWSLSNSWRIPATQFTPEQLDYLQTNSKRFELVNEKGEKVDR
jgi:hypothetical protein